MKKLVYFIAGALLMLLVSNVFPRADEKIRNIFDNVGWVDAQGYPEGTKMKILHDEGEVKTFLLKAPKGFYLEAQSHNHFEQHFLLKGDYFIDGKQYKQGTFQCFKPNESHGPYEIKDASLLLVIYYPECSPQK